MDTAPLDRRVVVENASERSIRPLSELRESAYVVLLGEPGAGKSTSLRHEAAAEGGELVTCREVMSGLRLSGSSTAYVDALDEFRSGGSGKDKILQLATAISTSSIGRWRLTCRAEDWRYAADVSALRRAANNEPIIVAHLLPLDEREAQSILNALGATNPRKFVAEAHSRGAGAFLQNPLSLRLLHSVVTPNGNWPTTRFELFDKAVWALAHEHDPERTKDHLPSAEAIVEAASAICFYLLASGAKALWHSNSLPPGSGSSEFVRIPALQLEPDLASSTLDTALFRGEGFAFQPCHRVVAEFLAARFLAARVVGTADTAAFPLRRAIALITAKDQKAPTELRGLYAWYSAHLQKHGDPTGARQLIERDAATVLAYGDAAVFDVAGRRAMLVNLDKEDPFFLSSQDEATVLGGLAGDDLAGDFIAILDSEIRSHLQLTVLRALAEGPPVAATLRKLREIAATPERPDWMRERAAEIFTSKSNDKMAARHAVLKDLAACEPDRSQLAIRARILGGMPPDKLPIQEFRQLLSDFNAFSALSQDRGETHVLGTLMPLVDALRQSPREEFFDRPLVLEINENTLDVEVRSLLSQGLEAAIDATPDLLAKRLLAWIRNVGELPSDKPQSGVVEAIQRWIDLDAKHRDLALFIALLEEGDSEDDPWMVSYHYRSVSEREPSERMINDLIEFAKDEAKGPRRKRLLKVAAYTARNGSHWPALRHTIVSTLEQEGRFKGFIKSLQSDPNARWKAREAKRKAKEAEDTKTARLEKISELSPKLTEISSGAASQLGVLRWAANHYRNTIIRREQPPLTTVIKYSNEEIAAAIAEGCIQFAINADVQFGVDDLGSAEAQNSSYHDEFVIAAGLHQALVHGRESRLDACPLIVALVGLRSNYFSRDNDPSIASWAAKRLAQDPKEGTELLLRYWHAALDAGEDYLSAIQHINTELASGCLRRLLVERPNLPEQALRQALSACAPVLTSSELVDVARRAVISHHLESRQRDIWNYVALVLMPSETEDQLSDHQLQAALLAPNREIRDAFAELCPLPDEIDRMRVGIHGKSVPADEDDWMRSASVSRTIRTAIQRLSASKAPTAGEILNSLTPRVHQSWKPHIAHAAAEHARRSRDEIYVSPSVGDLMKAVSNGPPASPTDLAAVVLEELERYRRTLRTSNVMPWKRFWNTDKYGATTQPQIENEDRDRLLELLGPRFERYGIAASLPEAQRGENTRADVLLLSHAGKNLPIEAKRHNNAELWSAASDQLAGYASDEGAHGYGIYLVFWFGKEIRIPARSDGKATPDSAEELERMLSDDLSPDLREKLTVIVLDVSRPESMVKAVQSRNRRSTR